MAKKKATVIAKNSAYQELIGWSGGKPAITKAGKYLAAGKWYAKAKLDVDDGVIVSSANPPQLYYWVMGGGYYVKAGDVEFK